MRTLTLDDLFALESLDGALGNGQDIHPDGRRLAYVVVRAKHTALIHKYPRLQAMDRADVWLADVETGSSQNLTSGLKDGSGWWAPAWSPSGARLAMLSTRGGGVHLWILDLSSTTLRKVTDRQVRLQFGQQPFQWLDDDRILCQLLTPGDAPVQMVLENRSADQAMAAWPVAWAGKHPTVSVLRSGADVPLHHCDVTLAIVDVTHPASSTAIADGLARFATHQDVVVSPDQRMVTTLVPSRFVPRVTDDRLTLTPPYRLRLDVHALTPDGTSPGIVLDDVVPDSIAWNLNGTAITCAIMRGSAPDRDLDVMLYDFRTRTMASLRLDQLQPVIDEGRRPVWLDADRLAVLAAHPGPGRRADRLDWWILTETMAAMCLTEDLDSPPATLHVVDGRVLGVADGRLLDLAPGRDSVGMPPDDVIVSRVITTGRGHIVVEAGDHADRAVLRVDPQSGATDTVSLPGHTTVRTVAADGTAILQATDGERGSALSWVSFTGLDRRDHAPVVAHRANTWLEEITLGQASSFPYRSLNGEELTGWLLLPGDHRGTDASLPLVVFPYPGSRHDDQRPWQSSVTNDAAVNLPFLTAAGYAVLLPSMPQESRDRRSDPMLDLPNGVMPAIDHVITAGIADPDRLFLYGHSYGGFAVYGLLTQTTRFRAAIASAGISNLISLHGTFDARARYAEAIDVHPFVQWWTESGQADMGGPPWRDQGRYLRNSPIAAVDRIATPLMIIHTDLDFVPIQQAEEIFSALQRQGKTVEFVRYWGESHVLESPANIRDQWERILDWFGRHAGVSTGG
jgi:dipeptidyl aminopeptidase/acylaminoacyl peptidase